MTTTIKIPKEISLQICQICLLLFLFQSTVPHKTVYYLLIQFILPKIQLCQIAFQKTLFLYQTHLMLSNTTLYVGLMKIK